MKKYVLLIFVMLLIHIAANSQSPCLPGGITFTTQEEIDNFQTNYPGCAEIAGDVTIYGIDITNLEGLSVLTSVVGPLNLWYNPALISLSGLENLTSVGGLQIDRCDALTSLIALESLTSISGDLEINSNHSLANLIGFEGLTGITGNLIIRGYIALGVCYYNSLKSLEGLENIESIGGYLMINGTDSLTNMHGLEGLNFIGESLIIGLIGMPNTLGGNIVLTCLEGLGNLNTIGEDLHIEANTVLKNLTGLEGLTAIGGSLLINYNDSLKDLNGLEGLTAINGGLTIGHNNTNWGNPKLTDISGLENIEAGTIGWLDIEGNDLLSDCSISNLCNYLASPNAYVYISNNAPGCNSPEEVEEHCLTKTEEQNNESGLTIIPNPSNDRISISLPALNNITRLSIFNVSGEKVMEKQLKDTETRIDISALPRGVYFVRLQNEIIVETGVMVKQ